MSTRHGQLTHHVLRKVLPLREGKPLKVIEDPRDRSKRFPRETRSAQAALGVACRPDFARRGAADYPGSCKAQIHLALEDFLVIGTRTEEHDERHVLLLHGVVKFPDRRSRVGSAGLRLAYLLAGGHLFYS